MQRNAKAYEMVRLSSPSADGIREDAEVDGLAWSARSVMSTRQSCMQWLICALSALSGFLFGYDLCVMVIALPLIQDSFELSTAAAESVVSILMVGAVFGSLGGGLGADWIGRKPAIIVTAVFFLLGSLCMTFARTIEEMLLGRFLAGLAVGSSGPCVSVYLAEMALPEQRGVLVTINEVMLCVGCVVSVIISGSLQDSENGWRKMLGVTLAPPVIQLLGMPFMPESPRWLLAKDRTQEANAVLRTLFNDSSTSHAQLKSQPLPSGLNRDLRATIREIIDNPTTRLRVLLSLSVAIGQMLTGANAMLYYSSYIIKELHPGVAVPSHLSKEICVAIAKLAGVCSSIALVDRVGRRPLLLVGSVVMFASHLIFAACFAAIDLDPSSNLQTIGVWNLYLFIYAWNLSWAPLMWVVCAEVLPNDMRSLGMGLTFATFWMASAIVNQTLLTCFHILGIILTFLLYAGLTAAALAFVYIKVPETKGLSFEQITALFTLPSPDDEPFTAMGSSLQEQWDEFECVLSMFPGEGEVVYDADLRAAYEEHVYNGACVPSTWLQYTLRYVDTPLGREIPELEIKYPPTYPATTVDFTVHCPSLPRLSMEELLTDLTCLATGTNGEVIVLQLYQRMQEMLTEQHAKRSKEGVDDDDDDDALCGELNAVTIAARLPQAPKIPVLGRRAIYFHHIIAATKQRVVVEWALELQLGGFSKIGWPGVVIVEGHEACAQEYVRRLQHLRWKQIVVRGEQIVEGHAGQSIDDLRLLPRGFQRFGVDAMSALAAACRVAGVEDLFLSVMKIYRSSDDNEDGAAPTQVTKLKHKQPEQQRQRKT
ncbi:TPA: hypothetical protein N0F65_008243 [Lagenidium giganteum]|uniref:Hexose transporter 1 n=1 Tax=Lagenidium giganteum TaxID=4803 RepID=A0AAV2YYH7_9STRA|nr:TPA: hypothetical protein N0F65_008243 [Lagenidium giganteum]